MQRGIFGILNYNSDSFYEVGKHSSADEALAGAQQLIDGGATYIDIGAEATNPKVDGPIAAQQEIDRLKNILPHLLTRFPGIVSLDSYHPETLEYYLQYGRLASNDVSGFYNPKMLKVAARNGLVCIAGHLPPEAKGVPIRAHELQMDSFEDVVKQMLATAARLAMHGVGESEIILDPNIGFGKTPRLNWQLVKKFASAVPYPVMIGASHKRFLGHDEHTGEVLPDGEILRHTRERNLLAARYAFESGATYLRAHEPQWYKELLAL